MVDVSKNDDILFILCVSVMVINGVVGFLDESYNLIKISLIKNINKWMFLIFVIVIW